VTILLLDIPGLQLAYLGCYGNDWVATPNLDRLASEGVLFDAHYLGRPGDLRSGRCHFPRPTEVADESGADRNWFLENNAPISFCVMEALDVLSAPLSERFSKILKGVVAALKKKPRPEKQLIWAEFPSLAPPWDLPSDMLDAYFDESSEPPVEEEDEEEDDEEEDSAPQAEQTKPCDSLQPWPHPPAQLPPGDDSFDRLQFTYAAVVTYVDAQIGWLIDKLRPGGLLDQIMLVVTASSALSLGEHGWIGRQRAWQHEEAVHLPLLLRFPKGEQAGWRIGALTQSIDIVPTLMDYLELAPAPLPGRSLRPLIAHEVNEVHEHIASGDRVGDSVEWSLRTLEWALLLPLAGPAGDPQRLPQLYVKPDDRWEVNNVYQHHPELVEQMEKTLRAREEASKEPRTK
jgi:arylsulfatase A-like enzyme